MSYSVVDGAVGVSGSLGAELPYGPAVAMVRVEKSDESVERVAIGPFRIGLRRA